VQRQAERLRELGHDVVVVVPVPYIPRWLSWVPRWRRYRRQQEKHDVGGFETYLLPFVRPPGAWFQPYEWLATYYGVRRTVGRLHTIKPFDVLYSQDSCSDVPAAVRIANDLDIPSVGMAIGGDLNLCAHRRAAYRRTVIRGLKGCDTVVCNSEALVEKVKELTEGRQSAVGITRGVDIHFFCPVDTAAGQLRLRRDLGLPEHGLLIIYAGYLQRDKGVFELVQAFAHAAKLRSNAFLILAGEGADSQHLIRLAAETEAAERMQFLGHVNHDQMPALMQACDIAVMTSWREGMPNALIEAMACGLPAVATAVGGIPQAVQHGRSGLLVPPRDVPAIAEALTRLASDAAQRERFGREARAIAVADFDARKNARRLAALLEQTVLTYQNRRTIVSATDQHCDDVHLKAPRCR